MPLLWSEKTVMNRQYLLLLRGEDIFQSQPFGL